MFLKKKNPYNTKPNTNLIGLDEKKKILKEFIKGGNICFLNGPPGTGKSSMLAWLKNNLKRHKVIYIDGKGLDEYFDLDKHLDAQKNLFQKIFGLHPKNIVILIDEAQECLASFINNLQAHWNVDQIKSIVLTQISSDLANFPNSFKERIGRKIIRMRRLNEEEIKELINLRTKGKHKFEDDAISVIAEKADYIPRRVLELCEIVNNQVNKNKICGEDVERIVNQLEEELLIGEPLQLEKPSKKIEDDALIPLELIDKTERLSPMQKKIVKLLLEDRRTTKQLAKILNTSPGSVGKQLSELTKLKVVGVINDRRPKIYSVLQSFKDHLLAKNNQF